MKITVGVSARHAHLTESTFRKLFGNVEFSKRNDLNQIGEFASNYTVTLKTEKSMIENVRILGPFREYDQVEISLTDAFKLGVKPPVRRSGVLEDSEGVTLVGNIGETKIENGLILAERHVHMNNEKALELGLKDKDVVTIKVEGVKAGTMEANVKVSDNAYYELHLDTDDANAFGLSNNDEVELIK